jgi:hypothetical protein
MTIRSAQGTLLQGRLAHLTHLNCRGQKEKEGPQIRVHPTDLLRVLQEDRHHLRLRHLMRILHQVLQKQLRSSSH